MASEHQQPQLQNDGPIYSQPTLKQQQLYQQLNSLQQPQPLQQPVIISPISGMVTMSKIKVKQNENNTYKTDFPLDLDGVMSAQEYTNYINDFNEILSIKKRSIVTILVAQLISALIFILFAIEKLKIERSTKDKVKEINEKLLNRKIYFETTLKLSSPGSRKRYRVKLSIHYPTLGFIAPPQMYQPSFPIQQPSLILTTPIYQPQTDLQQQQYINTIDENIEQRSLLK
ncbi:hypothetical protein ACTFIZ_002080 [Dictyostelium cf. discoideum]